MMLVGCLLGLASALMLAWDGVACARVLVVLLGRPPMPMPMSEFGTRLVHVSWAPIGVAAGTALMLLGHQQVQRRIASSTASNVLVLLSGIVAGMAAISIATGIQQAQAVLTVVSTIQRGMTAESIQAALHIADIPVSRGWMLLATAQSILAAAAIVQALARSGGSSTIPMRPKADLATIALLGLFGVILSWSWFANGSAIERIRDDQPIKASELVAQILHVLSSTLWGAWILLAAMLVLALTAGMGCWKALASNE